VGSRLLYFAGDRLSHAELTAACLDGDIVEPGQRGQTRARHGTPLEDWTRRRADR